MLFELSSCSPSPEVIAIKTAGARTQTPEVIETPKPTQTSIQTPTLPVINEAKFTHPVGGDIPMYNFYDLNPEEGIVESNAGLDIKPNLSTDSWSCRGKYFIEMQLDNHFAYDYGAGGCGADIEGHPAYGMSVGFSGIVTEIYKDTEYQAKGISVNYGLIRCADGTVREIVIKYYHSDPAIQVGEEVNSEVVVAYLDNISYEVEIQVHARDVDKKFRPINDFSFINPQIIGLEPRIE